MSTQITGTLVWVGEAINPERDGVRFYVLRITKYLEIEKLSVPSRSGDAEAFL